MKVEENKVDYRLHFELEVPQHRKFHISLEEQSLTHSFKYTSDSLWTSS